MKLRKLMITVISMTLLPLSLAAQTEICNNGMDDDGDGLIDLNDPDCPCSTIVIDQGTGSYIRNHSFEDQVCCPYGFATWGNPWLQCATGWVQATNSTSDYLHMCGYAPVGMNLPPPDGQGAVGFYAMTTYKEYVGTCLTWPLPSNPLIGGVTYTISMWLSAAATDDQHTQSLEQGQAVDALYPDQLPLAIFGVANECVPWPVDTYFSSRDCVGDVPGWNELGRVYVQPSWDWQRVSITFTPSDDIHTIIIGSACDLPASFDERAYTDSQGQTANLMPYFIADDLMLTVAGDQLLLPVEVEGSICGENALATGVPPTGMTDLQWYRNGVAITGQTGTTLDISALGLDGGTFTLGGQVNGECLMGSAFLPEAIIPQPIPAIEPIEGCIPLEVAFADLTANAQTILWDLGDGTTTTDSAFTHTYGQPGSYNISLTVRNAEGCSNDTVITNAITTYGWPSGSIQVSPNPVFSDHPVVTLDGSGSTNTASWWWDLGSAIPSTAEGVITTATFPSDTGSYPVILVLTSEAGCVDTVYATVIVTDPGPIEMPNVFSPNSDGSNDRFVPNEAWRAAGRLDIYNRWGQLLYTTHNLEQGWDGGDQPGGTYYYIVTPDNPNYDKSAGHFTLLR